MPHVILVTGATGFVGQAVVHTLLDAGMRVRALARAGSRWPFEEHARLERVDGDMRDRASLEHALTGVTHVIHLAAAKNDEAESEAVNVDGARNLAAACAKAGVISIVNVSTQSAKLAKRGRYGETKAQADMILHAGATPVTTLRCSLVYGDLTSGVFGSILGFANLPVIPVIGSGTVTFRPMHRDDLADIIVRTLETGKGQGRMIDTGGPDELTFNQLLAEILRRKGAQKPVIHLPIPVALFIARCVSFLPRPPLTVSNVLGSAENIRVDIREMLELFGFTPRGFQQGLSELLPAHAANDNEATALLRYVLSSARPRIMPDAAMINAYREATMSLGIRQHALDASVLKSPGLLGALDAATRLRLPSCVLQQKLLIATAVAECHPLTAEWLLPKERGLTSWCLQAARLTLRAAMKLLCATPLLFQPAFLRRNAGT